MTVSETDISRSEGVLLTAMVMGCSAMIWAAFNSKGEPIVASLGFSGIAFAATYCLIPWLGNSFKRVGLKGRDLAKNHRPELPETMGAVCAIVHLFCMILFIPFPFYEYLVTATSGGGNREASVEMTKIEMGRPLHRFPHNKLGEYLSALLSLNCILLLGIGDDLFDIRWRHKLFMPAIGAIPMLVIYFVDFGVTDIVIPTQLRPWLGTMLNLGPAYYVYMGAIAILCPNAINILAGVNGIEVGQSVVIGLMIVANDVLYVTQPGHPAMDSHLFSLYFLLPFLGVSLALMRYNWFPASVFVGDTYCYFAGMLFAVVGILGHFSKTLLLLFIPQIFNFAYSTPQIFGVVPCPRHRLPRFNARSHLLEPSTMEFPRPPGKLANVLLTLLEKLRMCKVTRSSEGKIMEASNLTILNLWLVWFGPMREDSLAMSLMVVQFVAGVIALGVRHGLAFLVYDTDNM